jgi:dihydroorotase
MSGTIIKNAAIVNEGKIFVADVLLRDGLIDKIGISITAEGAEIIDASGLHLFPGVIDDQVHFREPGLTHKGNIYSESRAAVAGGITSFMEMPNTVPNTLTQELLEEKYNIASQSSFANYSFFMGVSNDNTEEVLKTDPENVCGIKIFMGSSTGNMLVDNAKTLDSIFSRSPMLIATHCEDEATIKRNLEKYRQQFGDDIPVKYHPLIRSEEACYLSSSFAVAMAKKHNTRLHILHISTAKETTLFENALPLSQKRITAEACVHHLWFSDADYAQRGNFIKWNPAIKTADDREAIWKAVLDNRIDVIATDHAPHTIDEKKQIYIKAPGGGPLVQHSLVAMLECYHQGKISLERIAEKMSHAPAECFRIKRRGYIREGYYADLVLVNLNDPWEVNSSNILYRCRWSPFEGVTFQSRINKTMVNGNCVYDNGVISEQHRGMRLKFITN